MKVRRCALLTFEFWVPVVTGVVCLFLALARWRQGQRRRSLADRWWSLMNVALALVAGFAVVGSLANPRMFDYWWDLGLAALLLATCALVVAVVYSIRETRRESGMQQ
jgi:quinol-cytochrome oxidoreductase complex cytochrome b subunit